MKALLYEGPSRVALRDVPKPAIGPGEALVRVEACGLCGTDLLKIFGPALAPPVAIGHEVAGVVQALGRGVKGFKIGDRVVVAHHAPCYKCHYCARGSHSMCREFKRTNIVPGGFSQFIQVSAAHVKHTMLKIPAKLGFAEASQVEPLACVLRNVRRLAPRKGDAVVIVGLGSIGLMSAQAFARKGAQVIGLDLDESRVALAKKAGIKHASTGERAEELIGELSDGRGADILIFTVGTPALVAERLKWLRDGGTLNVFSSFHPDGGAFPLNPFYHREINIISSYSAAPEDLREALSLIAKGEIAMTPQTKDRFALEDWDEAVRRVRSREIFKAIFLPQTSSTRSVSSRELPQEAAL
ncbi:MAG: alcohol dehydrogenase catalytic domain-containing protein [Proteobacteria bacterium]|nr:alcohol dehydrogenase catalytic domain-containing protein [Pseudomonadota bacterium]